MTDSQRSDVNSHSLCSDAPPACYGVVYLNKGEHWRRVLQSRLLPPLITQWRGRGMKVSSGFLDRTRSLQTITTVAHFWRFCEGEPIALRLTLRKGKYV